jgi:hypothetical protein
MVSDTLSITLTAPKFLLTFRSSMRAKPSSLVVYQ